MCWSCGCSSPGDDHGDGRNLTTVDLRNAAEASGISVPEVVGNIARTLHLYRGRQKAAQVAKEGEQGWVAVQVLKASEERRFTLGLAYPADRPDVSVASDGHRDFAGADVLEAAAWSYLTKSGSVGLHHLDGTEGHGRVVESYIFRGPDWHVTAVDGSEQVIKAGDWLMGTVWDEPTWAAVKRRELNGLSPQGRAQRRKPSAEALAKLR